MTPQQASGNPGSDVQSCQSLAREAMNCCNNPASCVGAMGSLNAANPDGVVDTCRQMQSAGLQSGNYNGRAADMCLAKYTACVTSCNSMADSYNARPDVAQTMRSQAQQCSGLSVRVSELNSLGSNSYTAADGGANCNSLGGAMPQGLGSNGGGSDGMDPNSQNAMNDPQQAAICAQNPTAPGCQGGANAQELARGDASFTSGSADKNGSKFNLADNMDGFQPTGFMGNSQDPSGAPGGRGGPGAPPQVPNNSGGSIPGQGGGAQPAKLDKPRGGGYGSQGGYNMDDLEKGFLSGGYSQPAGSGLSSGGGGVGGFGGNGAGGGGSSRGLAGKMGTRIDLKQYLPGGAHDPSRRGFGGLVRPRGTQIHGRYVNIWNVITERMVEKCRIGELIDCGA